MTRDGSALVKYNWIEKTITASVVTVGYLAGEVPPRVMTLIVLTNWAWIPFLFYYDLKLRSAQEIPEARSA